MGAAAVDLLLEGKSNLVVCVRDDKLTSMEITHALKLDRMYKGTLKEGDLDGYSAETIAEMQAFCDKKLDAMKKLYETARAISVH